MMPPSSSAGMAPTLNKKPAGPVRPRRPPLPSVRYSDGPETRPRPVRGHHLPPAMIRRMIDDKKHHGVYVEADLVIIKPESRGLRAAVVPLPWFALESG